MSKEYSAGEELTASDINKIVAVAGLYATDAGGDDTYAITVSPTPDNYTDGDEYTFKPSTVNTGACTLNVNSLGAKSIKKFVSGSKVDPNNGDIAANQPVRVKYDGTDFVIMSPVLSTQYKNGVDTRDLSTASGNQTIAHGLGKIPKMVRITAIVGISTGGQNYIWSLSQGSFNGTTTASVYEGSNSNAQGFQGTSTTYIINLIAPDINSTTPQTASITIDDTNITLAWTKDGSTTGTAQITWEAER